MINELAIFEKEPDAVEATTSSLLSTLSFPKHANASAISDFTPGWARTLLILDGAGAVAGMAIFFINYSTWRGAPGVYLEDLFVRPSFRRRGYAQALLKELAAETVRIGGKRFEWSCLKWNENALEFYSTLGAKQMDEWVGLRVDGEALEKLAARGVER
jgi:GNAT superfamily N-acetyltransferase